jgi:predicted nucleic acid-binding protein
VRFVDTSYWVGLRFRRDGRHDDARALWEAGTGALLTSNLVMGETWTFLRRKAGYRAAAAFRDAAGKLPTLTVRHVDADTDSDAWAWLARRDERPYSYVDATSFAIMRRLRIRQALAFDGYFSAAGFIEVRPA